jgi:hypothetical protein
MLFKSSALTSWNPKSHIRLVAENLYLLFSVQNTYFEIPCRVAQNSLLTTDNIWTSHAMFFFFFVPSRIFNFLHRYWRCRLNDDYVIPPQFQLPRRVVTSSQRFSPFALCFIRHLFHRHHKHHSRNTSLHLTCSFLSTLWQVRAYLHADISSYFLAFGSGWDSE